MFVNSVNPNVGDRPGTQMMSCNWIYRIFGGLLLDIKRKAPHYLSDYTDAVSLQCLASFLFLYCACMSPVITFGGLLGEATEGRIVRTHICEFILAKTCILVNYAVTDVIFFPILSLECNRVSIWSLYDGYSIFFVCWAAPHYPGQHRTCLGL